MSVMNWNGKQVAIEGTVIEDIIKGFWQVSEDLFYDKLWKQEEDKKFVDPTPDDPQWLNDKGSDSDRIHYKLH